MADTKRRQHLDQQRLLFAAGGLFAVYYVCFFFFGIYTGASLLTGLVMALALAVAGALVVRVSRRAEVLHVGVGLVLGLGAVISAAFSDGTRCIGFHTIWALPMIYALFIRARWPGHVSIGLTSMLGGLLLLQRDGVALDRILQWMVLSLSASAFTFVRQRLDRRDAERTQLEREAAQARLALADRMSSVGMLAAGVAHEVNNPMSYIGSNVALVARALPELQQRAGDRPGGELNEALLDALVGCERVNAVVKTLSRLSRTEGPVVAHVDLNQALAGIIKLSRRDLQPIARVHFHAGELPTVRGDESRLGQVFLNLLVNAVHAIEARPDGPRTVDVRTYRRGEQAVVEVSDSGCGIDEKTLGRMFDPFFTTKPPGKGTGLGLSLCKEIVDQHAGTIEVESHAGEGATFRVVLPGEPLAS